MTYRRYMNTKHPGMAKMALWSSSIRKHVLSEKCKEVQSGQNGGQEVVKVIVKDKENEVSRTSL